MNKFESHFRRFMTNSGYKEGTINSYCSSIKNVVDNYISVYIDSSHHNLFDIIDLKLLHYLQGKLLNCKSFIDESSERRHNAPTCALDKYIEFATEYNRATKQVQNTVEKPGSTNIDNQTRSVEEIESDMAIFSKYGTDIPQELQLEYDLAIKEEKFKNIFDALYKKTLELVNGSNISVNIRIDYSPSTGLTLTDCRKEM